MTSNLNVLICCFALPYGWYQCDPPAAERRDDVFMGNTVWRNDWCVSHVRHVDVIGAQYWFGYVLYDLRFILGPGLCTTHGLGMLLHHIASGFGTIPVLFTGKYIGTMAVLSLFCEVSTPFNNLRLWLSIHKMNKGTVYKINGIFFTLTFLFCRGVFQFW
jgi:hypothetical protein